MPGAGGGLRQLSIVMQPCGQAADGGGIGTGDGGGLVDGSLTGGDVEDPAGPGDGGGQLAAATGSAT